MTIQSDEGRFEELIKEIEVNFKKIDFLTLTESFLNLETSERNLRSVTNLLSDT